MVLKKVASKYALFQFADIPIKAQPPPIINDNQPESICELRFSLVSRAPTTYDLNLLTGQA